MSCTVQECVLTLSNETGSPLSGGYWKYLSSWLWSVRTSWS